MDERQTLLIWARGQWVGLPCVYCESRQQILNGCCSRRAAGILIAELSLIFCQSLPLPNHRNRLAEMQ